MGPLGVVPYVPITCMYMRIARSQRFLSSVGVLDGIKEFFTELY